MEISNKISSIVYDVEKSKAIFKETISRIEQIDKNLKNGETVQSESSIKLKNSQDEIANLEDNIEFVNNRKLIHINELKNLDHLIFNLSNKNKKLEFDKMKINDRYEKILSLNNQFEVNLLKLNENLKIINNNRNETNSRINNLKLKESLIAKELQNNSAIVIDLKAQVEKISKFILKIEDKIKDFNDNIEESKIILKNSDTQTFRFDEKNKILLESMSVDLTISEIIKDNDLRFVGIVQDLVKWDKNYLRPVMAGGFEWLKVVVVNNVEEMIRVAEFAKVRKLPRVKIIPLDIIQLSEKVVLYEENTAIIGNLSTFLHSEYKKLIDFIFGNTIVVRTAREAYNLSVKGYRSVSIDGEFFEPKSKILLVDYNSAVVDFVTEINLKNDIESLRVLIMSLKNSLFKKTTESQQFTR